MEPHFQLSHIFLLGGIFILNSLVKICPAKATELAEPSCLNLGAFFLTESNQGVLFVYRALMRAQLIPFVEPERPETLPGPEPEPEDGKVDPKRKRNSGRRPSNTPRTSASFLPASVLSGA